MRVLLLSPLSPAGGIASWSRNVLEYINENRLNYIVHIDSSVKYKRLTNKNKFRRLFSGIIDTTRVFAKLKNECIRIKPDVVHITSSASLALLKDLFFLTLLKILSIDCVFHYRFGRIPELKKKNNWEWKLLLFLIFHSKKSIVIDSLSYNTLALEREISSKIVLIPNPCANDVKQLALSNNRQAEKRVYIFVGHVIPAKGVFELVKSFSTLSGELELFLIGPYEEKIKRQLFQIAKDKGDGSWLNFTGSKDKHFVLDMMKIASALVLPSYTEGFPNVVLEAMACGCPVISTNVGAIPDMLDISSTPDKSSGICVSPYSVKELTDALIKFENSTINRETYSINGKKKVIRCYTMDRIFPLYENIWRG